jgi:hypothetical protein
MTELLFPVAIEPAGVYPRQHEIVLADLEYPW